MTIVLSMRTTMTAMKTTMMKMKHQHVFLAVLVQVFLWKEGLAHKSDHSCKTPEGTCQFSSGTIADCQWDSKGWICGKRDGDPNNTYAQLNSSKRIGTFKMKLCSTDTSGEDILEFQYLLQTASGTKPDELFVWQRSKDGNLFRLLMNVSSDDSDVNWRNASVPVPRMEDFTIRISARRSDDNSSDTVIGIDNIRYERQPYVPNDRGHHTHIYVTIISIALGSVVTLAVVVIIWATRRRCRKRHKIRKRVKSDNHLNNNNAERNVAGSPDTLTLCTVDRSVHGATNRAFHSPSDTEDGEPYSTIDESCIPDTVTPPTLSKPAIPVGPRRIPVPASPGEPPAHIPSDTSPHLDSGTSSETHVGDGSDTGTATATPPTDLSAEADAANTEPPAPGERKEEECSCLKSAEKPVEAKSRKGNADGENEGGKVYDRLGGATTTDSEVYSQIQRDRKPEVVIDSTYSHIQ